MGTRADAEVRGPDGRVHQVPAAVRPCAGDNTVRPRPPCGTTDSATCPLPCSCSSPSLHRLPPIDVGDRKQLFIDERFIAARERIELRANPPQKLGLLRDENDKPFQGHVARVIDDGGKVRLYLGHEDVQVLESDDGLKFRRTGAKLPGGQFPTIFLDPHETDPAKKYKLFHLEFSSPVRPGQARGVRELLGRRGEVHEGRAGAPVLHRQPDRRPLGRADQEVRHLHPRVRLRLGEPAAGRAHRDGRPAQAVAVHEDGEAPAVPVDRRTSRWCTPPTRRTTRTRTCTTTRPERTRGRRTCTSCSPPTSGTSRRERNPFVRPRVKGQWEDYGMLEVQLAVSRDGVKWSRPERTAYIPNGLGRRVGPVVHGGGPRLRAAGQLRLPVLLLLRPPARLRDPAARSTTRSRSRRAASASCGSGWTGSCRPTPTTRAGG